MAADDRLQLGDRRILGFLDDGDDLRYVYFSPVDADSLLVAS